MAVVQSVYGTSGGSSNANPTATLPAAPTVGNLLVAFVLTSFTGSSISTPNAGWSQPTGTAGSGVTNSASSIAVWVRTVQAGDTTTVAPGTLNSSRNWDLVVAEIDGTTVTGVNAGGTTSNVTSFATSVGSVSGDTVLACASLGTAGDSGFAASAGYTVIQSDGDANRPTMLLASGTAAGATSSPTLSWTPADKGNWAVIAVTPAGGGGGASFTRSASDTATATDSAAARATVTRGSSDTATASDTTSRLNASARSPADAAVVTDTVTVRVVTAQTITDSATASDTTTRTVASPRTIGDTTTADPTLSTVAAGSRDTADAVSITDTATGSSAHNITRSISDTTSADDTTTTRLALTAAVSDSTTVVDALTVQLGSTRSITDTATVLATLLRQQAQARDAADALTVDDTADSNVTHIVVQPILLDLTDVTARLAFTADQPRLTATAGTPRLAFTAGRPTFKEP